MSDNTPETRIELSNHSRRAKNRGNEEKPEPQKTMIKLFNKDGKPNNVNEAKISFSFEEDEENNSFVLTLMIYKYVCNFSVFIMYILLYFINFYHKYCLGALLQQQYILWQGSQINHLNTVNTKP